MILRFENLKDSPLNILRRAGYSFFRHEKVDEMSFIKKVSGGDYPRFHVYVKVLASGGVEINLHLDQKRPSYRGSAAHSGEYGDDNKLLETEAEIIRKEFNSFS